MSLANPSVSATTHYLRRRRQRLILLAALALALIASVALDVATGPSGMALERLLQILRDPASVPRVEAVIVWNVRLPYALMAVLVGAALALAGVEMQTVLGNPLASPFTLGVSAAAALGAALAIVLGLALPGVPPAYVVAANAFVFALASVGLLYLLALWRGFGVESLVLFGIALVFSFNALVALLQFVASQDTLQQLVFWTLGSLARASWDKLGILFGVFAVLLPLSMMSSWKLTALRLGEDRAVSFGIDVRRLRLTTLLRISILSALAVAFVGPIGFIGLVAPHIARMIFGEDHRFYLPASALIGALVLSMASVASKNLVPGVIIPVGIVTSLVGVPFFLSIILRHRGNV